MYIHIYIYIHTYTNRCIFFCFGGGRHTKCLYTLLLGRTMKRDICGHWLTPPLQPPDGEDYACRRLARRASFACLGDIFCADDDFFLDDFDFFADALVSAICHPRIISIGNESAGELSGNRFSKSVNVYSCQLLSLIVKESASRSGAPAWGHSSSRSGQS